MGLLGQECAHGQEPARNLLEMGGRGRARADSSIRVKDGMGLLGQECAYGQEPARNLLETESLERRVQTPAHPMGAAAGRVADPPRRRADDSAEHP